MRPEPYQLNAEDALPGFEPGVKASRASTGGSISVIDSTTTGGAPLHVHRDEDECFFVIEGAIVVRCGDDRWKVESGGFVFLPKGIPHAWDVVGESARLLIITTPGGLEQFLKEFHESQPDQRDDVAAQFGITFLPDPEW